MTAHRLTPAIAAPEGPSWNRELAVVALVVWAARIPVLRGVTTATLVVLVLVPVWLGAVGQFRWARRLLVGGVAAVAAGVALTIAQSSVRPFSTSVMTAQFFALIGIVGGIGLILWARTHLSDGMIAAIAGATMLVMALPELGSTANDWKYLFSAPLTLLLMGLLNTQWLAAVVALGALGVAGVALDSRSYFGMCVLAAGILLLQQRRKADIRGWGSRVVTIAIGAALALGAYSMVSSLLVEGYLGDQAAVRTQEQIQRTGSLLVGGRPEWSGTIELLKAHPQGFGLGAAPTYEDVWTARVGLDRAGVGPDNRYVDNYMFAGEFKLHSVLADLWAQTGLIGLAWGLALLVVIVVGLVDLVLMGQVAPVAAFLAVKGLWDLGFSPIFSSAQWLTLAVGMLLLPRVLTVARASQGSTVPRT